MQKSTAEGKSNHNNAGVLIIYTYMYTTRIILPQIGRAS